jgi:hypothetical protein
VAIVRSRLSAMGREMRSERASARSYCLKSWSVRPRRSRSPQKKFGRSGLRCSIHPYWEQRNLRSWDSPSLHNAVGMCVGDLRAYLVNRDGQARILTEGAAKHRLGSGQSQPFPIRLTLNAGDVLLLLSDGAWTPLTLYTLQKAVTSAAIKHLSEVPAAILDAAGRIGRADDMTAVAVRLVR